MNRSRCVVPVLLCLLAVPAVADDKVVPWSEGKATGVTADHLAMPMTDEEFYFDRYSTEAWFKDGTHAWVSVVVHNMGPGSGKLTVKSRWYEKSGKEHYSKQELKPGQYTISNKPFSVEAGGHKLSGVPRTIKVHGKSGPYTYDLTFASGLAPWRPGTGRINFGDEGQYYDTTLVQPKAKVTGSVSGPSGKAQLEGHGYVIHSHGNIAPYFMQKRYLYVRSFDGDTVVWMGHMITSAKYGAKPVGYLYVARGEKVLVATGGVRLGTGNNKVDSQHENKYAIPWELTAAAKRGNTTVKVKLVATKQIGRDDVLKGMGAIEAALMKPFAQPVDYTLEANVTVSVQEGDAAPVESTEPAAYEVSWVAK